MLVACGGDDAPGPHDVIACDVVYPAAPMQCERACAKTPSGSGTCIVPIPGKPAPEQCNVLFVTSHEGQLGCCIANGATEPVRFVECQ